VNKYIVRSVSLIGLALILLLAAPAASHAQVSVGISIRIGPPALPVYVQPVLPAPGYIWTPGYWAYGPQGYFWVPGTWVEPPTVGLLWTPGYWGWNNGIFVWNEGYWGPHLGFYGGVNYGFGYGGVGFVGGEWRGGSFFYNRAVCNVTGVNITNVYNRTVVINRTVTNVSYNGGPGGISARPTPAEASAAHEPHTQLTTAQTQHIHLAAANRAQLATVNGGKPAIAASPKPGVFTGKGVVAARAAGPGKAPAGAGSPKPMTAGAKPGGGGTPKVEEHRAAPVATGKPSGGGPPKAAEYHPAPKQTTAPKPQGQPKPAGQPKPQGQPKPESKPKPEGKP
jgi:hypothetical protein